MMFLTETCGAVYPGGNKLICLKPIGHEGKHATCLGYYPDPYNEYEWVEW